MNTRTNIVLDDKLVKKAMKITGAKTKREVVDIALRPVKEHACRPALKQLLESRAPDIEATNEPQRIAGNAPDFVVRRGATPLGHVECKDLGEPLEKLLKPGQLRRYTQAFPGQRRSRGRESGRTESGKVWINARQYFDGIDAETFAFRIGGYQVLEKWLKDRKGRALDIDDITHYRKIAVALARTRTRELMREADAVAAPLFVALPDRAGE